MRVRVALVAACYAFVLIGGALVHHAARCPETARSRCAVCACLSVVPLSTPSISVTAESTLVGTVIASADPTPITVTVVALAARAPPASAVTANLPPFTV